MVKKTPSALLLLPFLIQIASAGTVDVVPASIGGDASAAAGAAAGASPITQVPSLVGAASLTMPAPSLAAPAGSVVALPAVAGAALPVLPAAAAASTPEQSAATPGSAQSAALTGGRAAAAVATLPAASANVPDGTAAGRVRFDGQDAAAPADATPVPSGGSPAKVPAYVSEYRRLVEKIADNARKRRAYMRDLPAGESIQNDLLDFHAQSVAPEYEADNRALAALVKAHPNVEYESAGLLGRIGMRLTGRGPRKTDEGAPAPGMVRFNGADFPVVSFTRDWMVRAIDAARVSVELFVTPKDVTPELIAALARAKARNVSLKLVGGAFSYDFMFGPLAAELRRQGIVIHYKIGLSDAPIGVYDEALALRGSMNVSRTARDQAYVAENDRGRVSSFEQELRAGWAQGWKPTEKTVRFNGAVLPSYSENHDAFVRAVDAAKISVDLSLREHDLTPEVIGALVRAKTRNVDLRLVGGSFSPEFMYGPVAEELRRQGIVIHYKIGIGKRHMVGVYDQALVVQAGFNDRLAGEYILADEDRANLKTSEQEFRESWDRGSLDAPSPAK